MQSWEITKDRAQLSLTVWTQHAPALTIGTQGTTELNALIVQFEPLVQLRAVKQDDADAAYRAGQTTLQKLKLLGTRIPQILEGQLGDNVLLMKDLKDVYQISPRSEGTILERARALYPLWVRANTTLAAMTPAQPPITRVLQGVAQTAAMFKALLDGYTTQVQAISDTEGLLDSTRKDLTDLDDATDTLIKKWYKVMKASYDPGSPEYEALDSIPTEGTCARHHRDQHRAARRHQRTASAGGLRSRRRCACHDEAAQVDGRRRGRRLHPQRPVDGCRRCHRPIHHRSGGESRNRSD